MRSAVRAKVLTIAAALTSAAAMVFLAAPTQASTVVRVTIDSGAWDWHPTFRFALTDGSESLDSLDWRICKAPRKSTAGAGAVVLCDIPIRDEASYVTYQVLDAPATRPADGAYVPSAAAGRGTILPGMDLQDYVFGDDPIGSLRQSSGTHVLTFTLNADFLERVSKRRADLGLQSLAEVMAAGAAGTLCDGARNYGPGRRDSQTPPGGGTVCVTAGSGETTVRGSLGDDTIVVIAQDPDAQVRVTAEAGDDVIVVSGPGDVRVSGGAGTDVFVDADSDGRATFSGGAGADFAVSGKASSVRAEVVLGGVDGILNRGCLELHSAEECRALGFGSS